MGVQTDFSPVCFAAEDSAADDPATEDSTAEDPAPDNPAAEDFLAADLSAKLFTPGPSAEVLAPEPTPTSEVFTLVSTAEDPGSAAKDPGPSEVFVPGLPVVFASGSPDEVLAPGAC